MPKAGVRTPSEFIDALIQDIQVNAYDGIECTADEVKTAYSRLGLRKRDILVAYYQQGIQMSRLAAEQGISRQAIALYKKNALIQMGDWIRKLRKENAYTAADNVN